MKKVMFKILGALFMFVGILFLLNSASSITGFVIIENINKTTSSTIGIVFLIIGILLFVTREEGKLEREVIKREIIDPSMHPIWKEAERYRKSMRITRLKEGEFYVRVCREPAPGGATRGHLEAYIKRGRQFYNWYRINTFGSGLYEMMPHDPKKRKVINEDEL